MIAVIIELIAILAVLITKENKLDQEGRNEFRLQITKINGWVFGGMFILLFVCVLWLISRLRKKRDMILRGTLEQNFYNTEIFTLWVILGVFSITYLLRALWDILTDPKHASFETMLIDMNIGIVCDFFPVMLLMIYHYRNFKDKKAG